MEEKNKQTERYNEIETELTDVLLRYGGLYKSDFILFAKKRLNMKINFITNKIARLKEKGMITEGELCVNINYDYQHGKRDCIKPVITLTDDYFNKLVEAKNLSESRLEVLTHNHNIAMGERANASHSKALSFFNTNHVKILFDMAGVIVDNKPRLTDLKFTLPTYFNQNEIDKIDNTYGWILYDWLDKKQNKEKEVRKKLHVNDEVFYDTICSYLDRGIFYTLQEYRHEIFNKGISVSQVNERASSVAKGIVIRREQIKGSNNYHLRTYVVYSNAITDSPNTMVYIKDIKVEKSLIESLSKEGYNDVYQIGTIKNNISAILITENNSAIQSAAANKKYGLGTTRKSIITLNSESPLLRRISFRDEFIDYTYNALYAINHSLEGIEQIKYLVQHTLDSHLNEIDKLISSNSLHQAFTRNIVPFADERTAQISSQTKQIADTVFPYKYKYSKFSLKALFMPVIELVTLNEIKQSNEEVAIVTRPEFYDVIQHITHKEHVLININNLELEFEDKAYIYDEYGGIKGKSVIAKYLKNNGGFKLTREEYNRLPEKFGYKDTEGNSDSVRFFNDIANGTLSVKEVLADFKPNSDNILNTTKYIPIKKKDKDNKDETTKLKRKRTHAVYLEPDIYAKIVNYANAHHLTIRAAANRCLKFEAPKVNEFLENEDKEN